MRVSFADVTFDSEERSVKRGDVALHLSPKAFDLLRVLIDASPRAVRKEEIVDAVWPDVIVEEANVRNLVAEIRGAIGPLAARAIVTLPRVGYAFRRDSGEANFEPQCSIVVNGAESALPAGVTVVGRADDCGVVVHASGVSRHHLRIAVTRNAAIVEDLGSKNGTWINGRKLGAVVAVRDGDEICVGSAVLRVRLSTSEQATTTFVRGAASGGD